MLAKINRWILPNFTRKKLDLARASSWQKAVIAWKYFVTKNSLH